MPKPKKKQPNLARAERALSRLVDGAASEDGPSDDRDFTASAFKQKGKRSKLSRKEQRKQDRAAKKQASLKHFQKKGDVGKKSSKKKGKDKVSLLLGSMRFSQAPLLAVSSNVTLRAPAAVPTLLCQRRAFLLLRGCTLFLVDPIPDMTSRR